jgi:hypothetical protein
MNPIKLVKTIIPSFVFLSALTFFFYLAPKTVFAGPCRIDPGPAEADKPYILLVDKDTPGDYTIRVYHDFSLPPVFTETKNVSSLDPLVFTIPGSYLTEDALNSPGVTVAVSDPFGTNCLPGPVRLALAVSSPGAGANPCPGGTCETALGPISSDPGEFVGRILEIGLGVAGGIAFILMVIGSIRVLTSSGDQQKLAGGRDMIVAAVAGLLFLIFSVLILQFIGADIFGGTLNPFG